MLPFVPLFSYPLKKQEYYVVLFHILASGTWVWKT